MFAQIIGNGWIKIGCLDPSLFDAVGQDNVAPGKEKKETVVRRKNVKELASHLGIIFYATRG